MLARYFFLSVIHIPLAKYIEYYSTVLFRLAVRVSTLRCVHRVVRTVYIAYSVQAKSNTT